MGIIVNPGPARCPRGLSMGHGNRETMDFSIVLDYMAKCSGIEQLVSEDIDVPDGLEND